MKKPLSKSKKILLAIALCLILCALVALGFELSLRNVARQVAVSRAAVIVNNAVTASAYRGDLVSYYDKLVVIQRNDLGEIQSVRIDGYAVSQLSGQIQASVVTMVEADSQKPLTISLSSILGTAAIGVSGPRFTVDCSALPSVDVNIQSKFEEAGINQTKHSITANIHTYVRLYVSGRLTVYENTTPVLLCETVIVGKVPSAYLQNNSDNSLLPLLPLTP